jgi:hypothetical protein
MYSGTHFAGWLGAAQYPGFVAASKRLAFAYSNPNTHANAHADANSFTHP